MGGGEKARHEVHSLLGNLQTKIFHANTDFVTNQYASDIIAKNWQSRRSSNMSISPGNEGAGSRVQKSTGDSEMLEYEVIPRTFTTLRKGGYENDCIVEGIVFQGGRIWEASGGSFLRVGFNQNEF